MRRETQVAPDASITAHTANRLDRITIILLLIVGGIVIVDRLVPEGYVEAPDATIASSPGAETQQVVSAQSGTKQSVAVIPFVNMSDEEANEYFSDGISEELLNLLVGLENLRVPSRTSSFTFKGSDKKADEIGRELNVEHVLEGSVRKAGNRIRVTAQLVEASTDTHLWSETYTRELTDIFAVQDEIARAIVDALQITLSGGDRQKLDHHSTGNVEAYDLYLTGRYLWHSRLADSMRKAIGHFKAAIDLDPDYEQAWAALAEVYTVLPEYGAGSVDEYIPLARDAIRRTLEINPNSAQALAASGGIKASYDYDWKGANEDLQRAVLLAPEYATARQWYGEVLVLQGRLEEALEQLRLARISDPLSAVVRHVPGYFLLWNFRFEEAEKHYMDELELGRPIRWTYQNMDMLKTLTGEFDEARKWAIKLAEMEGFDPAADLARIDAVENPSLQDRALELLKRRTDISEGVFGKGLQYALLGESELALASLEIGFDEGDPYSTSMNYMKVYDSIRDNPRFQAMLDAMNLAGD